MEKIVDAFTLIAQLAEAVGAIPMSRWPNGWTRRLDDHWRITVNGTNQVLKYRPDDGMGWDIQPFHCFAEYNGWPAGEFHPYGGWIAAGTGANEEAFLKALRAAVEIERRATPGREDVG